MKRKLRLGKHRQLRQAGRLSAHAKPGGRFWKRQASKAARRGAGVDGGASGGVAAYKKAWGPFVWA